MSIQQSFLYNNGVFTPSSSPYESLPENTPIDDKVMESIGYSKGLTFDVEHGTECEIVLYEEIDGFSLKHPFLLEVTIISRVYTVYVDTIWEVLDVINKYSGMMLASLFTSIYTDYVDLLDYVTKDKQYEMYLHKKQQKEEWKKEREEREKHI